MKPTSHRQGQTNNTFCEPSGVAKINTRWVPRQTYVSFLTATTRNKLITNNDQVHCPIHFKVSRTRCPSPSAYHTWLSRAVNPNYTFKVHLSSLPASITHCAWSWFAKFRLILVFEWQWLVLILVWMEEHWGGCMPSFSCSCLFWWFSAKRSFCQIHDLKDQLIVIARDGVDQGEATHEEPITDAEFASAWVIFPLQIQILGFPESIL